MLDQLLNNFLIFYCVGKGTRCSDIRTCADCQSQPYCGWCDDGSDRGLGTCMAGAASGPVVNDSAYTAANSTCPVHRWFFTDCPCV